MTLLTAGSRMLGDIPAEAQIASTISPLPLDKASTRDPRIDFFRGIALIGIALNHTVPPPTVYNTFGHYQFGHFFSFAFADMFVFLSGMVCAMAYTRVLEREGWWGGQKKAIRRCAQIYVANLIAFLVVVALMFVAHAVKNTKVVFLDFDTSRLKNIGTWLRVLWMSPGYNHFNILKFYVVMLMLMPAGLWLYRWKRWASIIPSVAAYAYIQAADRFHLPGKDATDGPFGNYLAWQFLFFMGLWIGNEVKRGNLRLNLSGAALAGLTLFLVASDYLRQMKLAHHHLANKEMMGPLRIAELLAVVALVGQCMPKDAKLLLTGAGSWLTQLGTRSLEIFALTLVSCYLFTHLAAMLNVGRTGYALLLITEAAFVIAAGKGIIAILCGDGRAPSNRTQSTPEIQKSLRRKAA